MWSSAAVVALALVACASAPPTDRRIVRRFEPMDHTAVTDVLRTQADAWNRGDLAGYMDGYAKTDNLVFTSGGKVRRGWRATFDTYQQKYAAKPGAMGHLEFGVIQIDALGADGAVVLGTWRLSGSEHPGNGVFTVVFARLSEGWRIVHDHTSLASP